MTRAGLEIADVVRGVVDELHGADPAPVRFLEPLELALEEVQALDVQDDRGGAGLVGRLEVGHREDAANAVLGGQRVEPVEALLVVLVEEAGLGLAQRPEHVAGVAPEDRPVGHVGQAEAPRSRPPRMPRARSSLGRAVREVTPFGPAWVCTSIDTCSREQPARGGVRLRGRRRRVGPGPRVAGEHRGGGGEPRAPVTAAVHGALLPGVAAGIHGQAGAQFGTLPLAMRPGFGLILALLLSAWPATAHGAAAAPEPPTPDQTLLRWIYKELVEINTADSVG